MKRDALRGEARVQACELGGIAIGDGARGADEDEDRRAVCAGRGGQRVERLSLEVRDLGTAPATSRQGRDERDQSGEKYPSPHAPGRYAGSAFASTNGYIRRVA